MALAIDSQEPSNVGHNSVTSPLTWTFTNTAGTLLLCGVVASESGAGEDVPTVTGVTYNGVPMVSLGSEPWGNNGGTGGTMFNIVYLFYLLNPAIGANTVSVSTTYPASPVNMDTIAGCISFTGNDPTTPVGTAFKARLDTGAGDTTPTVNVTGTTSGNYVIACMGTGSGGTTANAPSALTWSKDVSLHTAGDNAAMLQRTTSGGTVTTAFTVTQDWWGIIAVEVHAAATLLVDGPRGDRRPFPFTPGSAQQRM